MPNPKKLEILERLNRVLGDDIRVHEDMRHSMENLISFYLDEYVGWIENNVVPEARDVDKEESISQEHSIELRSEIAGFNACRAEIQHKFKELKNKI